jgi:hypothetical protein
MIRAALLGAALLGVAALLPGAPAAGACDRPYSSSSPWNTPITRSRVIAPAPQLGSGTNLQLTSDPTQYTYPVYRVGPGTPRVPVRTRDWYSRVSRDGRKLINRRRGTARVPLPRHARPAAGTDAQIVVIERATGVEWNLSEFRWTRAGGRARNVGRYSVRFNGVPPRARGGDPWWLRGAGVPYLAGLVRPCEIARGRIDHALAFATPRITSRWVHPATKSDGEPPSSLAPAGDGGLPAGRRLQLDPSISEATMRQQWGCRGPCLTIARALQTYGMFVIDGGIRPKVMLEYERTAGWDGRVSEHTVSPIPLGAFVAVAGR